MRYCYCFASTAKQKTLKTPLTAVLANALAVSSFLGKFPLTAERPFFCVFEKKKNTFRLC